MSENHKCVQMFVHTRLAWDVKLLTADAVVAIHIKKQNDKNRNVQYMTKSNC